MRLYLVRHGIASERLGPGVTRDADRPLTDEGKDEMRVVARGLARLNVKPDVVLCQPTGAHPRNC
jgi:phosphohistidine phosphatase SixA